MPRNMLGICCHRPHIIKHLSWWHTPHLDCIISSLLSLRSCEQHAAIGLGSRTNKPAIMLAFCRAHTQIEGKKGLVLSLSLWASWQRSLWMRCPVSSPSALGKLKLYTRGCLALAPWTIAPGLHHYFNLSRLCYSECARRIVLFVLLYCCYSTKKKVIHQRTIWLPMQPSVCLTPFPLLVAIVWVTGKWKKENVPAFGVFSNRERSPCVTTALFGIWGVLLSRKADNWSSVQRLKRLFVWIN